MPTPFPLGSGAPYCGRRLEPYKDELVELYAKLGKTKLVHEEMKRRYGQKWCWAPPFDFSQDESVLGLLRRELDLAGVFRHETKRYRRRPETSLLNDLSALHLEDIKYLRDCARIIAASKRDYIWL